MKYRLGVDLGTTYTSAAVFTTGWPTMVGLGNRAMQVPSVLYLKPDGSFLVGEAAEQRGRSDPERVAREFKRRLGDEVPLMVAGTPVAPETLSATLLTWVIDLVAERQGGAPDHVTVTHPANWGPFKRATFRDMLALAGFPRASTCTEPEASAVLFAARESLAVGACIAVYDLGGGTFDVAVLRRTSDGFEFLGKPEGIDQLGGMDFDEAIFQHVLSGLGDLSDIDGADDETGDGLRRLRRDCVEAKEALSGDTEAVVPVTLPGLTTSVRIVRREFEEMIAPGIDETIRVMGRAIERAGVTPEDLVSIVLCGGSSRIPLVSHQLVSAFGRPLALNTHPKHDIALGATLFASAVPEKRLVPVLERDLDAPSSVRPQDRATEETEPEQRQDPFPGVPPEPHDGLRLQTPERRSADAGDVPGTAPSRRPAGVLVLAAVAVAVTVALAAYVVPRLLGGDSPPPGRSDGPAQIPDSTIILGLVAGQASGLWAYDVNTDGWTDLDSPGSQASPSPDRTRFTFLRSNHAHVGTWPNVDDELLVSEDSARCGGTVRPAWQADGDHLAITCLSEDTDVDDKDIVILDDRGNETARVDPLRQPTGLSWINETFLVYESEGQELRWIDVSVPESPREGPLVSPRVGIAIQPEYAEERRELLYLHKPSAVAHAPGGVLMTQPLTLGPAGPQTSGPPAPVDFGVPAQELGLASATWSVDQRAIAVLGTDRAGARSLYVLTEDGTRWGYEKVRPEEGEGNASTPAWGSR